jgi:hypothetical protein
MSYLPVEVLQRTVLPEGDDEDILTDILEIEELWTGFYPIIQYYPLDKRTTSLRNTGDGSLNVDTLVGESGASKFDMLWGESMDPGQTTWVQPQGTAGAVKANDVEVFKAPIPVNARVTVVRKHQKLEKYGFDTNDKWIGQLIVSIPVSILDRLGIYAQPGDKLLWDSDFFTVFSPSRTGLWKNTNIQLYVNLLCPRLRHGS